MQIKILSSEVIDQIAAGEVVDRPAHLVKELIENALDAEATEIEVAVDEGGRQVSVLDNGTGIFKDDLPLVFNRHATSKISQSADLWNLRTYGFRGEAVASIAAVSRMAFVSRQRGVSQAYKVASEFGRISPVERSAAPEGTQVDVYDLFANTPARKKFLKTDSAEVSQIKNVIKAMAMANPLVQFRVKLNGKLYFLYQKGQSFLERAQQVLEIKKLYHAHHLHEGFSVEIAFSDPGTTLRVARQIWFFVQGRWVQDRTLQAAVLEAYRSLLMHGEYPYCVVKMTAPSDEVDVNVHPTKSQVKFMRANEAFRAVHNCLRHALEQAPWMEVKPSSKASPSVVQLKPQNLAFAQPTFNNFHFKQKAAVLADPSLYTKPDRRENPTLQQLHELAAIPQAPVAKDLRQWSSLQVIGQVDLTYIVAQSATSMFLIDQHAAHERVAYERIMVGWREGRIEQQAYLLPLTIDLEETEVEALKGCQLELAKIGLIIEQSGPTTISIESAPAIMSEKGILIALKQLAYEITEKGGSFAFERAVGDIFATMACHSVIRAGQALSKEEMGQLLVDMDEFPLSGFCPHGRSVAIEQEFLQLEKDFGRRV